MFEWCTYAEKNLLQSKKSSSLPDRSVMARDDEGTFLDDKSKDGDAENAASIERGEEDDAANGNKSIEECDGEEMTMADHHFTVKNLLQSELRKVERS
jgi:hypothetical protein